MKSKKHRSKRTKKRQALKTTSKTSGIKRTHLENDPVIKRIQLSEYILMLLQRGSLPNIRKFLLNTVFEFREVGAEVKLSRIKRKSSQINARPSEPASCVQMKFQNGGIRFIMSYEKMLNTNETIFYAQALGQIIVATYASLGFNMNHCQSTRLITEA